MRKPLLGLLVALGAAAAGFFWGRHVREESRRREDAARAVAAPAPQPAAGTPSPAEAPASDLPADLPADLPTDAARGDSVPQSLE